MELIDVTSGYDIDSAGLLRPHDLNATPRMAYPRWITEKGGGADTMRAASRSRSPRQRWVRWI